MPGSTSDVIIEVIPVEALSPAAQAATRWFAQRVREEIVRQRAAQAADAAQNPPPDEHQAAQEPPR